MNACRKSSLASLVQFAVLSLTCAACGAAPDGQGAAMAAAEAEAAAAPDPTPVVLRPAAAGTERLHAPITSFALDADGDGWIGFGPSQKAYVIPAARADMLAFARQALDDGRPVHATVRTSHGSKRPPRRAGPVDKDGIRVLWLGDVPDRGN